MKHLDSYYYGLTFFADHEQQVQQEISHFEGRFNQLKIDCRNGLTKKNIPVPQVVNALTDLPADDVHEHKHFLKSHMSIYYQANDHAELIGQLSFHMNYLSHHLLDYLGNEFGLVEVKGKMTIYKSDLQQFRKKTPLILFCRIQRRRRRRPQEGFNEMVVEFDWGESVTLEDVEQFRQVYASEYSLHNCAMMIAQIRSGSYIITWFIPESVVNKLKAKVPREILKKYCVTKLEIAGTCVYRSRKAMKVSGTDCNEVSNDRFTNRRSLSLHGPAVVQVAQHQLEPQDHLLQGMSLTHLHHVCGEVLYFSLQSYTISQPAQTIIRRRLSVCGAAITRLVLSSDIWTTAPAPPHIMLWQSHLTGSC